VLALIGVIGSSLLMNGKSNEMKHYRREGVVIAVAGAGQE
jgi:hypothetical protein